LALLSCNVKAVRLRIDAPSKRSGKMAYHEALERRVRDALAGRDGLSERKMFGGLCLMLNGNMVAGINSQGLMLRVGRERYPELLARPGARPMDFTGRPLNGYLYVEPSAFATADGLKEWLGHALTFVETLPPKGASKPMKSNRR
jgi:TfoX/Sxy family transcriptional regulator of competence genes